MQDRPIQCALFLGNRFEAEAPQTSFAGANAGANDDVGGP